MLTIRVLWTKLNIKLYNEYYCAQFREVKSTRSTKFYHRQIS